MYNPGNNLFAWKEWHKRMLQILWLLLLPFLSLWLMMLFAREKSNLLVSIAISGLLFFISYVHVHVAYLFLQKTF